MRLLLDESLPRGLTRFLTGHDVVTVAEVGWAGMKNGELLNRASESFDVFLTIDANLPYQQVLERFSIAVVLLRALSNRLADLEPWPPRFSHVWPRSSRASFTLSAHNTRVELTRCA